MMQLESANARTSYGSLADMLRGVWGICALVAVLCVLGRLPFLIAPGLSVDSYANLDGWPSMERFVSQGRFGQFLVLHGLEKIGVDPQTCATLFQAVGLATFAFAAPLFFVAFAGVRIEHRLALTLSSLLMVLHPFQAEILTFSEASFTALLAVAMGICAVYVVSRELSLWWLSAALLVFAISLYQLVLNYVSVMVLLGALSVYLREPRLGEPWLAYRPVAISAATVAGALVTYLLINKALLAALGVDQVARGQTLALDQLGTRWTDVKVLFAWLWEHPLLLAPSRVLGLIFWGFVTAGWGLLLFRVIRYWRVGSPIALLAFVSMPVAGLGLVLVGTSWWPAPRVLGGVVAVFAIACYWLCASARTTRGRVVTASVAGVLLVSCIAIGHRIHSDQRLLNSHDGFLAEEIYSALREHEGFSEQTPVAVVNTRLTWSHPASLPTTWMDMNISAFAVPSTARARIALSTGRILNIRQATDADVAGCVDAPKWPEMGFVSPGPEGDVLVCL